MIPCPKCGHEVEAEALECPYCGIVLAKYRAQLEAGEEPAEAKIPEVFAGSSPDFVTQGTLRALEQARPWIRLFVGYFFVGVVLSAGLGAALLVLAEGAQAAMGLVYVIYASTLLAVTLPLRRSEQAIRALTSLGATQGLETFAIEHSLFWRRSGIALATLLALLVVGLVLLGVLLFLGLATGAG